MAKSSFRGKPKKDKRPGMGNLFAQVEQMQQRMADQQEALAAEKVTVSAGGGAITVVISGHQRLESIKIEPELLNPEDAEMLQDLLVAAVNSAIEQSQALAAEKMEGITGGLGLGDLLGGLE